MKYNEPILISLKPVDYCVYEEQSERKEHDVPRDPRFDGSVEMDENDPRYLKYCGGRFDWGVHVYPEDPQEDPSIKLQLMRLWTTTMYTQMAAGLSYHAQGDSNIKVQLSEEELDTLAEINNKICKGIYDEIWDLNNTFMRKKNIKKLNL
jgi:hypothetical protein